MENGISRRILFKRTFNDRECNGSAHYYGQSECNVLLAQGVVYCLASDCEVRASLVREVNNNTETSGPSDNLAASTIPARPNRTIGHVDEHQCFAVTRVVA